MKCVICGIEVESIENAIGQGSVPYFYDGQIEYGPACSESDMRYHTRTCGLWHCHAEFRVQQCPGLTDFVRGQESVSQVILQKEIPDAVQFHYFRTGKICLHKTPVLRAVGVCHSYSQPAHGGHAGPISKSFLRWFLTMKAAVISVYGRVKLIFPNSSVFLFSLNCRNYKEGHSIQDGKEGSNGESIMGKTTRE